MVVRIVECIECYNRRRSPGEPAMTQARLAEALGVTQGAVSLWAHGKRAITVSTAFKIARLLDCQISDLFAMPSDSQHVIQPEVAS